ncbi:MAG: M23 family metallopeptidase [Patescibacteria group bacterium]
MSTSFSRFIVRAGLVVVRLLLAAKAILFRFARLLVVAARPLTKGILSLIFVPVYRAGFASRRHIVHWYRPAKSRFMFFVTNRAMMHVAILSVVGGTVAINLGMDAVRAETLDAFNKSLAYAVITQEESPVVEEYADMDIAALRSDATSYLSEGSLSPVLGASDGQDSMFVNTASLAGGGALAVPVLSGSSASVAPRDGIETYVVAEGDMLSTVAARFGISVNTVLWANNLSVKSVLKPGQSLTILPASGVVHTVKSGDTLIKIASTYNSDATNILSVNKLADSSAITVGQKLIIPGGTPPTPAPVKRPTSVASIFSPAPNKTGTAVSGSSRMIWPSDGHGIVRGLSWFHTGVDIDCNGHANGTSTDDNYAAADGIVTFAGPRFSGYAGGYGNLVIIDHGNGLSTRYGHNYSIYVKSGQQVTAGTPIARCGSTGNSSGTHLHFEVIGSNGSKDYRNPLEYIR